MLHQVQTLATPNKLPAQNEVEEKKKHKLRLRTSYVKHLNQMFINSYCVQPSRQHEYRRTKMQ